MHVGCDVHAFQLSRDAERTMDLEAQGCHIIRFWNVQVLQETDIVLMMILSACDEKKGLLG
jgi:very-short-patch-repair endonuclease